MNTSPATIEWLDYLRHRGVISMKVRQDIAHMFRHDNPAVRTQASIFCETMRQQHPELWVSFKAKMRVLGRL